MIPARRSSSLRYEVLIGAALAAACSFYTDCPCANQPKTTKPSSGGNAGAGGSAGAASGTSGTGGTAGLATEAGAAGASGESGVFIPVWQNVTNGLAGRNVACGGITRLSVKPDEDMILLGLAEAGLWASRDGGKHWNEIGDGRGSDVITNRPSFIVYDPADTRKFWESGIYVGAGMFRTDDDGATFQQLGEVTHNDSFSIDFSDSKRRTILAGGHEQAQMLWRTTDGGQTWENIGANLPTTCSFSSYPVFIDSKTYLMGCRNGILRSVDAGESWDEASSLGGAAEPLFAADGTIYWLDQTGGLEASSDSGETWTRVVGGGVLSTAPIELPDGRLVAGMSQALGISEDGGSRWKVFTTTSIVPSGVVYSVAQKAFFIWNSNCSGLIDDNVVQRLDFDFETQ